LLEKLLRRKKHLEIKYKGFGYPEDLAGCAFFLASKASDFVTGQSIAVDGGFSTSMLPHAWL